MKPALSKSDLFVGIATKEEVEETFAEIPWQPREFTYPPYNVVTPPPFYMFTLGSGMASGATLSAYNIEYNSGIDLFRLDFKSDNPNEPYINIDHLIASRTKNDGYAIYRDPATSYHWPKINDTVIQGAPPLWRPMIMNLLEKKRF